MSKFFSKNRYENVPNEQFDHRRAHHEPLFGEERSKDKVFDILFTVITSIVVFITFILGFTSQLMISPTNYYQINLVNIFFLLILILSIIPLILIMYTTWKKYLNNSYLHSCIQDSQHMITCLAAFEWMFAYTGVVYWYRQGELDPKFRKYIYYNASTTILLCICANLYFFDVDAKIPRNISGI